MASVCCDKNGLKRITFKGLDGQCRTLRLGKRSKKDANDIRQHVEAILASAGARLPLDQQTSLWLGDLDDELYSRFASVGLVNPRPETSSRSTPIGPALGCHLNDYLNRRTDMKSASKLVLGHVVRNLKDYFGADRLLSSITAGDCDDFARWLGTGGRRRGKNEESSRGLSPVTVGKRLQLASAMFRDAVRHKLITENPLAGVKHPKSNHRDRQAYVSAETIERLFSRCMSAAAGSGTLRASLMSTTCRRPRPTSLRRFRLTSFRKRRKKRRAP